MNPETTAWSPRIPTPLYKCIFTAPGHQLSYNSIGHSHPTKFLFHLPPAIKVNIVRWVTPTWLYNSCLTKFSLFLHSQVVLSLDSSLKKMTQHFSAANKGKPIGFLLAHKLWAVTQQYYACFLVLAIHTFYLLIVWWLCSVLIYHGGQVIHNSLVASIQCPNSVIPTCQC